MGRFINIKGKATFVIRIKIYYEIEETLGINLKEKMNRAELG